MLHDRVVASAAIPLISSAYHEIGEYRWRYTPDGSDGTRETIVQDKCLYMSQGGFAKGPNDAELVRVYT